MPYCQDQMIIFPEKYINSEFTFSEVLASTCTSLLLPSKPVQRYY